MDTFTLVQKDPALFQQTKIVHQKLLIEHFKLPCEISNQTRFYSIPSNIVYHFQHKPLIKHLLIQTPTAKGKNMKVIKWLANHAHLVVYLVL